MAIITRKPKSVKSAPTPTLPSVPDDDDYESWANRISGHYEPTPEDWASLRLDALGECSLADYLADAAAYQRSLDCERGHDLAAYLDRTLDLLALTGAPSLAELVDRLDTLETTCRADEYDRGYSDCETGRGYCPR